ncbi:hypothetical protein CANTEDRAFT_114143, partial [Yamadazyma tenuis ATCC 10573]
MIVKGSLDLETVIFSTTMERSKKRLTKAKKRLTKVKQREWKKSILSISMENWTFQRETATTTSILSTRMMRSVATAKPTPRNGAVMIATNPATKRRNSSSCPCSHSSTIIRNIWISTMTTI